MPLVILVCVVSGVSGQTTTWSESYEQFVYTTPEQRQKWTDFLASLKGKSFAAVTLSGSFDATGKSMTDPAAVNQLAQLLADGIAGTVTADGHTWTVTRCDVGNGVFGTGLTVDGIGTSCDCEDDYVLRPLSLIDDWGGINSPSGKSCKAASQTMKLEFRAGVTIVANGSTELCAGQKVVLTAKSDVCSGPLTYKWSNDATTESIEVTEPGTFSVTVSDGNLCSATSSPFTVNYAKTSVNVQVAGKDVSEILYSGQPVQLNAIGTSVGGKAVTTVNKFCLFDVPGGSADCGYAADGYICGEGLKEFEETTPFEVTTTLKNPVALNYIIYHSAWYQARINLKLNGETIHVYDDPNPPGECYNVYPTTVAIPESVFKGRWKDGANTLGMEVIGAGDFLIANLAIELVTSNVSYNWTPATGLDIASVSNPVAAPLETTPYLVTFTDGNGCTATDEVVIKVGGGQMPIAQCAPLEVQLTNTCVATVAAADFNNGSSSPSGLPLTYSISPSGPFQVGTTNVTFTVTDSNNQSSSCNTTIKVVDATVPVIPPLEALTFVNDLGSCSATVVLPLPAASDNCSITIVNDQLDQTFNVGPTVVTWTVTDANGNSQTATQLVTVTNAVPAVSSVIGPITPVAVGTSALLAVVYVDDNVSHATIDWADGSTPTVLNSPVLSFEASHSYTSAGTYTPTITLTDLCGAESTTVYESITVYNSRGGSVGGGGWFESPPGADRRNPRAEGRASYSFDAGYNGFSNVPQGSASFTFKATNLKFKSSQFDLLVIDGQTAQLTGTGTLNGKAGYDLLIAMVDDDTKMPKEKNNKQQKKSDRIRVRISDAAGTVIYDTQFGAPVDALAATHIGSGDIEIESTNFSSTTGNLTAFSFGEESTSVYPNPFIDDVNIQFVATSTAEVVVKMMDLAGRVISTRAFPVSTDGNYTFSVPETVNEGIYLMVIRQGERIEMLTVVKN